jgi:hypothetical protein
MPKFRLRSWAEQTLFDCRDYVVTADTLADAVELLQEIQERADYAGNHIEHDAIASAERGRIDGVAPLDPSEVADGCDGVTLIDAAGDRVRDLVGVPIGCVQLGEPIDGAELPPVDITHARVAAALRALLAWGAEHTGPRQPNSPHVLLVEAQAALRAAGVAL